MNIKQPGPKRQDIQPYRGKTVILWGQEDVLSRAVEGLLVPECGWRMIRISDDLDESSLSYAVERITPDVLIIHEDVFRGDIRLLIKFVQDYPKLKIITIGLENNQMQIYSKKTICIKQASDLLEAIKNGVGPEI